MNEQFRVWNKLKRFETEDAEAQLKGARPNRVMLLRAQYMQRKANKLATKARLAARPKTPEASRANTDVYAIWTFVAELEVAL